MKRAQRPEENWLRANGHMRPIFKTALLDDLIRMGHKKVFY